MLKRLSVVLATALTAVALLGTAANAATGTGSSNGRLVKLTGQNAAVYTDAVFGPVRCTEVAHKATKSAAAFDSITCTSTTGSPVYVAAGTVSNVGWNSDFDGSGHATGNFAYTVSADGMSYSGIATYPNG